MKDWGRTASKVLQKGRKDVRVSIHTNEPKSMPAKGYINIQGYDRLSDYLDMSSSEWIKLYQDAKDMDNSGIYVDSDKFKCYYKSNIVYITEID